MRCILMLLLLAPSVLACVVPQDGMVVDKSVQFCTNVYSASKGVKIVGSDITLDCNGAVLTSWAGGKGITIENARNVVVKGCRLLNYNTSFYVRNTSRVFLVDNHIVNSQVGARFVGVTRSATLNHDVSLKAPFEIVESTDNAFSLLNKRVAGTFCKDNYCNAQRSALEQFMAPPTTNAQFKTWLGEKITGKSEKQLKSIVLDGLY